MIDLPSEADIRCSAEWIFDAIIDFSGQGRWLTRSSALRGTVDVSSNPVALGTTYREPGPFGVRNGKVTEFERPTKITFHQPMTMRLHAGVVDVTLRYTLAPQGASTHVRRVVTIGVPWSLKVRRAAAGACVPGGERAHLACAQGIRRESEVTVWMPMCRGTDSPLQNRSPWARIGMTSPGRALSNARVLDEPGSEQFKRPGRALQPKSCGRAVPRSRFGRQRAARRVEPSPSR